MDVIDAGVENTDDVDELRMELESQRCALGDAEETCVFLLDDLVAAIFQEMQVRVQNTALFTTSARQMCAQVFEAVEVCACEPTDSLDRIQSGRQQILKSKWTPSVQRSFSATLVFLRRLLYFLGMREDRVGLELQQFPSSEAVSSLSGKRKLIGVRGGEEPLNEWCIPADQVSVFLQQLVAKGLVSAVPSTITFVMAVNREVFDVKNSQARVALSHLQHFVQRALLTAEEELESSDRLQSSQLPETESTPRSRIFQIEVSGVLKGTLKPDSGPEQKLLSSYLEEIPPQAVAMDRRAPGQVAKKAFLNSTQRAISRKVRLLLAPSPRLGSRWKTVRHKLIIPMDNTVSITAEAGMELNTASFKQPTETVTENEDIPDAASLSNIFALGTPRQLSAQEHARRNDLLAHLEREAARSRRRATTTAIASMSLNHPSETDEAVSSQEDEDFQAYVAANSTVTTGLSPTRPQNDQRGHGRAKIQRSKFELERDTLPFSVSDGNAHEQERLSAAICSPIKRPTASIISPPETPGRIQTASTLAQLPQLDSSRLAVGVSAVVRGIEKRGPRRNPSRNSRLHLHNYSTAFGDTDTNKGQMPFSPVRTAARDLSSNEDSYRLPVIPVVSPIKASPHRKHVAFKVQKDSDNERTAISISPKAHIRQCPSTKKQQVWEAITRSPPRARNHFASDKNFRNIQQYDENRGVPMAPRRNELTTSEYEDQ
ncbi:hypothetical protein F442_00183 [Phytophthora nicotianae P10297]|uniref:Uncharacterized protein n=2 Tax=Phytophthora nicotianae TaxID=4792 RepID=W3A9R2_PHYNI|nr:hypothetical protein F444_00191 [Phytophthora nicotianae P1976]ETP55244.1 hypothetical protein F442_00183 [Phytophthora nicotianae P10297]